jgi:putative tricarboxylic transport membrane protein
MISNGDPSILFSSVICWVLIALCVVGILSPLFFSRMEKKMKDSN